VKRPSDFEALSVEAQKRSGRPDLVEYPVAAAGTSIVLCRLSDDDHRDLVNGAFSSDDGARATAKNVALSKGRVWPDQPTMTAAIEAVPGLDKQLLKQIERLGGGDVAFLTVVDVRSTLDDSAIQALGIDPLQLQKLRKEYPHEGQLKIASYRDDELEIAWSCVLRLPANSALGLMLEGLNERGNETAVTFAVNAMAWPPREEASKFVRGQWRIAACLWPSLYAWSQKAALARPTIWRPKSVAFGTSTAQPMSSGKSSETSA
jgi:hypothetical protein